MGALHIPGGLALGLAAVAFVEPLPPLTGTVPPEKLADPDSRFLDVELSGANVRVHYKTGTCPRRSAPNFSRGDARLRTGLAPRAIEQRCR